MSWLFSQALVEEYLEDICSDGEQYAPLSGPLIQQAYCSPDKMTEFSRLSRFGMTFKPLTADRGEELLTLYLAGSRVRTSAPQGGGAGIEGSRSGMWKHMARIIGEVRPSYVFVENSPLLVGRGLAVVIGDLTALGYDSEWFCLSASDCGAPHKRDRIWLVAHSNRIRKLQPEGCKQKQRGRSSDCCTPMANSGSDNEQRQFSSIANEKKRERQKQRPIGSCGNGFRRWPAEPNVGRVAHGVAARVDRLKAIGNGQVSRVAATAFNLLFRGIK